jgi:hypothetical protein
MQHEQTVHRRVSHAILVLDQAGWHGAKDLKVPSNISLLPLPPRAPELNSQENIWQFMRQASPAAVRVPRNTRFLSYSIH